MAGLSPETIFLYENKCLVTILKGAEHMTQQKKIHLL